MTIIMSEYAWVCPNKQDSEYALGPKFARILNTGKFWRWQDSQYASVIQRSEYTRIWLDRVLNLSCVLNMPGFWRWQGSEYARVTQGSKYATIWLVGTWICLSISELTIIGRVVNMYHTIHSARLLYKLMSFYWEIGVFRVWSKI